VASRKRPLSFLSSLSARKSVWTPPELLVLEDRQVQRQRRLEANEGELVQGPHPTPDRPLAIGTVHDELGEQRVVVWGDLVAGVEVRVHPDARPAWRVVELDRPRLRQEVAPGVLGVDPELDRVPVGCQSLIRDLQALAGGHLELFRHQVHPAHHLGNRVLDL
jgi:hypothetical protein